MKKIEFGYNEDARLNGQWSSIEYYNGEFLDLFSYEDMDFLVTRIVDSKDGLNGRIDVREIAQDYYSDGSYITYGNLKKNPLCFKVEELLNSSRMKKKIDEGTTVRSLLADAGFPVHASNLREVTSKSESVPAVLTSVKPEVFGRLKASKKACRGRSMYDMAAELEKLRAKLQEVNATHTR